MLKGISSIALLVVIVSLVALALGGSLFSPSPILIVTQGVAVGLAVWAHISVWAAGVGVAVTTVVLIRIAVEERLLRERYADYGDYALTTKALIPFVA